MSKKTADILLYGTFGTDWWSGEGITAKNFVSELSALQKDDDIEIINVRINSPGGSIFEGVAIANAIAGSKKPVHTYNDGIAYSMGAICLASGKKVFAAKNSTTLIHCASGWAIGNVRDMEQAVDMMKKLDESLSITLADKTGLTVAEVKKKWMDYNDHTLTAQEALDEKLIDEIVDNAAENVPDNLKTMSTSELFAHYSKLNNHKQKESFFGSLKTIIRDAFPQSAPDNSKNKTMDFKNSLELLKKDKLTAEERSAITAEITAFTGENEKFSKKEVDAAVTAAVKAANDESAKTLKKAQDDLAASQEEVKSLKNPGGEVKKPVKDGKEEVQDRTDDKPDFADPSTDYNARANRALGIVPQS